MMHRLRPHRPFDKLRVALSNAEGRAFDKLTVSA
jgi:hypothetical protein